MIEMFSREEMWLFGSVLLKCVLLTLLIFFCVEAAGRLIKAKNEQHKNSNVDRRYRVERNEFEELGKAALNAQRMQSFIAETAGGRTIEVTVDEILEEVKERGDRVDNTE